EGRTRACATAGGTPRPAANPAGCESAPGCDEGAGTTACSRARANHERPQASLHAGAMTMALASLDSTRSRRVAIAILAGVIVLAAVIVFLIGWIPNRHY